MKVALIKPPLADHSNRGTGKYAKELLSHLNQQKDIIVDYVEPLKKYKEYDIVHFPYFDPFFLTLPLIKPIPTVVTVHDLIPLSLPELFPVGIKGNLKWQIQKKSLSKAKKVITDSIASKEDIVKIAGIRKEQVEVIYLGVGKEFGVIKDRERLTKTKKKYNLPDDFFLFVGDVNPNKNIPNVLRALKEIERKNKNVCIVMVGRGFIEPSRELERINAQISDLNIIPNVVKLGFIPKEDLINLYNLAKWYIQPSIMEGFGLPILEAGKCGCPTIVSSCSSLKEISPNNAIQIDPYNVQSIESGIQTALNTSTRKREEIIQEGKENAKKYSWENCAAKTVKIYTDILSSV